MTGIHSVFFKGLLQGAWIMSYALSSAAHSFSSRLRLAPPHCCCPWWSSHSTDISNIAGSSAATALHFHHRLSSWYQASTSPYDFFTPGSSTATEAGPLMASLGFSQCRPQLLSMTLPAFKTCQHNIELQPVLEHSFSVLSGITS